MDRKTLQIIYHKTMGEKKLAYGIRDAGGYLIFFPPVQHYTGQDERYERECKAQNELALNIMAGLMQVVDLEDGDCPNCGYPIVPTEDGR